MATRTDSSTLASHKLSDGELDHWNRLSTSSTTYAPSSTNDGASIYTTKTTASTRSMKDRFKTVFRRKKREENAVPVPKLPESPESLERPQLPQSSSSNKSKHKKQPSKGAWDDKSHRFTLDKDTGEYMDHTQMLHALAPRESFDSIPDYVERIPENQNPGEPLIASLSAKTWQHIASFLNVCEVASLAFTTKTLLDKLGSDSWTEINRPTNRAQRIKFLLQMDGSLPKHLYCPLCEKYHVRTQYGQESLKPTFTLNPLFVCPHENSTPPRIRITSGRTLPFTFVQLVLRAERWGPEYGLTCNQIARRWKEETGWSHTTVYRVHHGHLLMRVISQKFAEGGMVESAKRGFFYNMYEDFTPYFSVCAHWKDGELMPMVKCAVDHIPPPEYRLRDAHKMVQKPIPQKPSIVCMCGNCQPMRRCTDCPTEYLVEVRMVEDTKDPIYRFKQSFVLTRWSDLGDGTTPDNLEWAAVHGHGHYDSVMEIGRRAISGIFESKFSNDNMNIPGQRIISLNPKKEYAEDNGDGEDKWF